MVQDSYIYNGRTIVGLSRTGCIERRHFQRPLTTPNPDFKVTPVFDAEYLRNDNTNRDIHTPYSKVSFRMTSNDLEWLSDIGRFI